MANGNTPEREAYHQLFEELKSQEDAAGNRSFAKVLEKHPFPIYEANVRWFRMIKEGKSKDAQLTPGTDVKEFTVKVRGAVGEVLVAGFDLVWDVATAPVHLTLYPKIRHPVYKAVLAKLEALSNNSRLPVGDNPSKDGKEKIHYTQSMAENIPPENNQPPSDSSMPPADTTPPSPPEGTPPPPPEQVVPPKPPDVGPPPLGQERPSHTPEREAFHQLMRDLLEVTEPALREDMQDRAEATEALGVRTAQAWREFTQTPWNVPRHVRQMDTALRGRDLGSLRMRLGRILLYNTVRMIATGADLIDDAAQIPLRTFPGGGFLAAGVEFLSDELIRAGTEWTVQQATQTRQARFSSPIAVTMSRALNIVPYLGQHTNAPVLETQLRNAYNMPIAGVPIEYLYNAANRWLTQAHRDPRAQWMERFVFAVLGGARRDEGFRQDREMTQATP